MGCVTAMNQTLDEKADSCLMMYIATMHQGAPNCDSKHLFFHQPTFYFTNVVPMVVFEGDGVYV